MYTQLTSQKKNANESITDYILRAESAANALRNAKEIVSDGLLVAMVVKGLPDEFKPFIAVINQAEDIVQDFQKFKLALRNFEDAEQARTKSHSKSTGRNNSIMKAQDYYHHKYQPNPNITCYNCGISGHKSSECSKPKANHAKKWCSHYRSPTHTDKNCRKQKNSYHPVKSAVEPPESNHTFTFKVSDDGLFFDTESEEKFLVDCGATTHIVNTDLNFIKTDHSFKPEEHFIELADGSKANNIAKKRGTILISLLSSEGKVSKSKLENALYVPSFPQCNFSVQAVTRKGAKVNFDRDHAVLIAPDGTTSQIQQHGRLY